MRLILVISIALLVSGCNPEKRIKAKIKSAEEASRDAKYEVGMLCMEYILRHGRDPAYSKDLVRKLMDLGFNAEAVVAAGSLLKNYPGDSELFLLRATALQRQHQYDLALADAAKAGNRSFISTLEKEHALWKEIDQLNKGLTASGDSFNIMLQRAEKFFAMQKYDAALYDLGAISKMRSPADSAYFTQQVKSIYNNDRPVQTLEHMLDYFRNTK